MSEEILCWNCETVNNSDNEFCQNSDCGFKVIHRYCSYCGNELTNHDVKEGRKGVSHSCGQQHPEWSCYRCFTVYEL